MPARHRSSAAGCGAAGTRARHAARAPGDGTGAYLELRDYEKADQVTAEALAAIGPLSSSRIVDRVKGLRRRANRRHNDLDERIAGFLG
ncbi:hypothetical protein [Lentzea sp. NPDC004782]|uniref:hypothetical protein n=1 Tax=Lentzea sp. NPDC004782 TaxID=3154458 RepID=UPI0033B8602F